MIKLNTFLFPKVKDIDISKDLSLDILKNNDRYLALESEFLKQYAFTSLKTFSSNKDGFFSLLCELKHHGNIAVSKGESNALVEACKFYESFGFEIIWVEIQKNGQLDIASLEDKKIDFLFISSYVTDTFVKTDLAKVKKLTDAEIISNGTVNTSSYSDAIYFESYKLVGFAVSSVILSDKLFEEQSIGYKDNLSVALIFGALKEQKFYDDLKSRFKKALEDTFQDNIYFFVNSDLTLDCTLHFALRNLKARELIRTMALSGICITNGEGCSLGLSQPSRVIQCMGYSEELSRNAISLSFHENISSEDIEKIVKKMYKNYRQIKVLNGQ